MKKFNVIYTFIGEQGRRVQIPCDSNPIECRSLPELLMQLSANLPMRKALGVEIIGLKVEELDCKDEGSHYAMDEEEGR